MDDEGRFTVVDRIKDFINASGFKVWPREIERSPLHLSRSKVGCRDRDSG